jgi:hypothetical protein
MIIPFSPAEASTPSFLPGLSFFLFGSHRLPLPRNAKKIKKLRIIEIDNFSIIDYIIKNIRQSQTLREEGTESRGSWKTRQPGYRRIMPKVISAFLLLKYVNGKKAENSREKNVVQSF